MNRLTTFLLITFTFGVTNAQTIFTSNDTIFKNIITKYELIHDNLMSYDTTRIDISDESTEGSEAIAFYDGNNIKLIEVLWFGETGKRKTEYYFDNGQLFYAFDNEYDYNRPIYWDSIKAKETNDNEIYDPNKTTVKVDRYYFSNGKLITWVDNDKKEVDLLLGTNTLVGQGLIAHSSKVKDKFKK